MLSQLTSSSRKFRNFKRPRTCINKYPWQHICEPLNQKQGVTTNLEFEAILNLEHEVTLNQEQGVSLNQERGVTLNQEQGVSLNQEHGVTKNQEYGFTILKESLGSDEIN